MRQSIAAALLIVSWVGACLASNAAGPARKFTNIPPQPLASALESLARERDIQIIYRSDVVGKMKTAGVRGRLTLAEAVLKLLHGTGLTYRYLNDKTITILPDSEPAGAAATNPAAGDGTTTEGPVTVAAQTEKARRSFSGAFRLAQLLQGAAAAAQGAHAQSARGAAFGDPPIELNAIIVTAQRVQQRLQDVPISMTVLNQEQLSNQQISTTADLAAIIPSLSVQNEFGQDATSFSIRGSQQAIQSTPTVAVYFADAVVPRGGDVGENTGAGVAAGSLFDLQDVQVLEGPQGTLFGYNTDGGDVLLVPKRPTSQFGGYVEGGAGNYGMGQEQAVLNLPVTASFRLRLGVNHETRDGYLNNISGIGPASFGDLDFTAARLGAVLDIGDNLENYTVAQFNRSIDAGPLPQIFACNNAEALGVLCEAQLAYQRNKGPYAVVNLMPDAESYLRQYQVVNSTTWHASDALTVRNIANYGQLVTLLDSSIFGAYLLPTPGGNLPLFAASPNPTAAGADSTDQYTWSDEVQLRGAAINDELTWQGGAYLMHSGPLGELTGTLGQSLLHCADPASLMCAGPGVLSRSLSTIHYNDHAVYAQGTYALLPKLKLTAGARYTWDNSTATVHETEYAGFDPTIGGSPSLPATVICTSPLLPTPADVAAGCTQRFTESSSAPTYVLGPQYSLTRNLMLFAKYARGYREGGVATFVADGYHTYSPEHVNDYEIGEKESFSGRVKGAFDVTGFYDDITDQQLLAGFLGPRVSPSSGIVNAGKSRVWGIEVESTLQPVRPLSLYLSYSYLATKLLSAFQYLPSTGLYTQITFPATPGGPLPYAPRNKISLGANYQLRIPDDVGAISVGTNFTYTSSEYVGVTAGPFDYVSGYGVLGANLAWNGILGSPVDLQLFGTNLTNRFYCNDMEQEYETTFGFAGGYVGEPRMYGLRVRVNFGQ